jgi:CRISPR system Cascade subunit CasE
MDAIKPVDRQERANYRKEQLVPIARRWLDAQGLKKGFQIPQDVANNEDGMHVGPVRVNTYKVTNVERGKRGSPLSIGVLDIEGVLEVSDPDLLLTSIIQGFGRAKAFGCGLMLLKRA